MHNWTRFLGKTASMASGKLINPSILAIRIFLYTTLFQVSQHRKPKLGALGFRNVKTDQVLAAVDINPQDVVDSSALNYCPAMPDFVMHAVQENKRVYRIQRTVTRFIDCRKLRIGDMGYPIFPSHISRGCNRWWHVCPCHGIHAQYIAFQFLDDQFRRIIWTYLFFQQQKHKRFS